MFRELTKWIWWFWNWIIEKNLNFRFWISEAEIPLNLSDWLSADLLVTSRELVGTRLLYCRGMSPSSKLCLLNLWVWNHSEILNLNGRPLLYYLTDSEFEQRQQPIFAWIRCGPQKKLKGFNSMAPRERLHLGRRLRRIKLPGDYWQKCDNDLICFQKQKLQLSFPETGKIALTSFFRLCYTINGC